MNMLGTILLISGSATVIGEETYFSINPYFVLRSGRCIIGVVI